MGKHAQARRLVTLVLAACLAYLIVRPVSNNAVLVPVLGLLGAASAAAIFLNKRRASREMMFTVGGIVLVGIFGTVVGLGNPGLYSGILVWIVAPVLFGAWAVAHDEKMLRVSLVTAAVATIVLCALIILFAAGEVGLMPQLIPPFLIEQSGAFFDATGLSMGLVALDFYGLSTLVAVAPLWITAAMLPSHPLLPKRGVLIAAASLSAIVTSLSGRSAIVVVALVVPCLVWLASRFLPGGGWRSLRTWRLPALFAALGAFGITGLALAGNTIVQRTYERVSGFITGEVTSIDDQLRAEQVDELLKAWSTSPLVGHGWGATINGYARSDERAWDFEMQYHLILFQVGIIGVLFLLAAVGFGAVGFYQALRRRADMAPLLLGTGAGALALLIANGTNPYLQAPGHMWSVYLVLGVVNVALIRPSIPESLNLVNSEYTRQRPG